MDNFKERAFENEEIAIFPKIFLSVATPHNILQLEYISNLKALFQIKKYNLVTLTDWDENDPLRPISELMDGCMGCVVFLTERYFIEKGYIKKGSKNEREIHLQSHTTPWCHIEAAMAFSRNLPLLILRDKNVNADGLFDESIKRFKQVKVDINNFDEWRIDDKDYILNSYLQNIKSVKINKTKNMSDKKIINTFISYSSSDFDLMTLISEGLKDHLTQNRDFKFNLWDDRSIEMGDNWRDEINIAMQNAQVCILLVSATFASSRFINETELATFLERASQGNCIILPVLVREYRFSNFETLSKLQFFKTYNREYGFNKPVERNKMMPFDRLGEDEETTQKQLNDYYKNLSDKVLNSVKSKFIQ